MGDEVTVELVLSPRDEAVQSGLSDAPGWGVFVTHLRDALGQVIAANRVESLEIDELLVSQPLPDRYSYLRNGVQVDPEKAIDLIVGMVDGRGPYCRLSNAEGLRAEAGWDGAMHLSMPQETARNLPDLAGRHLRAQWRRVRPEPPDEFRQSRAVADQEFWNGIQVTAATEELTLLCERWAHGAHGNTWFRVTPENATQVAGSIRPRSLVCVVVNPDLRLKGGDLDDDFTAFPAPLQPGELSSRSYPGVDSLDEVTSHGYSLMLPDSALTRWCAVMPDPDGEARGPWKDHGAS
ncbi:hypothetical protein ACIG87_20600 [Micromonospora sp. NPDC051925]|uniref:hypothetical protein n=1 Tax=Micromonospora sp. NPDC051925 TaxID=3364288 RepID=UPI0037C64105